MRGLTHEAHPPSAGAGSFLLSATLAVTLHAALLFAFRLPRAEPMIVEAEGDSVEVALVEAAPPAPAPESPPPPPPRPEPEPIPLPKEPEMTLPEPPKPAPTPPPKQVPKPVPRPSAPARAASTAAVGASTPASAGTNRTGAGKVMGKPVYVVRPSPAYPAESRAAGEQGLVVLHIVVDARGRPTAVRVARSSGFPRLDRAAVEGGWRCRVNNAPEGGQFDAPVRFNLRD